MITAARAATVTAFLLASQTEPDTYFVVDTPSTSLNHLSGPLFLGCTFLRKWAHIAGLSVSATMREKTTENDMVTANCLYICPVMPPMKPTGTNMARKTSVVAAIGPVTSLIACNVAVSVSQWSLSIIKRTRSTTMIASSTTVPMTRTRPKSERILML